MVVGTSGVVGSVGADVAGDVGDVVAAAVDEAGDTPEPVMLSLLAPPSSALVASQFQDPVPTSRSY